MITVLLSFFHSGSYYNSDPTVFSEDLRANKYPHYLRRSTSPASARSARAKSAGGPGARSSAPGPAGGEFFEQCGAFVVKVWLKIAILRLNKIEIGELLLNLQRYVSKKVGPTIHM
jgi:hypothetical protein